MGVRLREALESSVIAVSLWALGIGCGTPAPTAVAIPVAAPSPPLSSQPPAQPVEPAGDPCAGLEPSAFDFPVGWPDAQGYYDAQPFGRNAHLGSDWNGVGGGDTDHGDPVSSVGDGRVRSVSDVGGGWGLVVRVVHHDGARCVESLYAHLSAALVQEGQRVSRGEQIGRIGDASGRYWAHLHLELRDRPGAPLGGGYGAPDGHLDPTAFIQARRPGSGRQR